MKNKTAIENNLHRLSGIPSWKIRDTCGIETIMYSTEATKGNI